MEKRFALFLFLSAAILFAHLMLQSKFPPPLPDQAGVGKDVGKEAGGEQPPAVAPALAEANPTPVELSSAELSPTKPDEKLSPPVAKESAVLAETVQTVPQQRVTLGSMTPDSPYRLLVTLDNQGAAVERIESVSYTHLTLPTNREV